MGADKPLRVGIFLAVLAAFCYHSTLKRFLMVTTGYGRTLEPLSSFSYTCRRIEDPRLAACEDMWLSETTRTLFLACSDPVARLQWHPNMAFLNASGRSLTDAIIALDVDRPRGAGFAYQILDTPNFSGINGDGTMNLLGLTGVDSVDPYIYLINNRPSGPREFISTIEKFQVDLGQGGMKHLTTFADPRIATPNNLAIAGDEAFYLTNDHGTSKYGLLHELSPIFGTGDVSYCDTHGCKQVSDGHRFPNGLVFGRDGRIYVPSAFVGGIHVYERQSDNSLKKVDYIDIPYAIDNLSVDAKGHILVPTFPTGLLALGPFRDPFGASPPVAVLEVRRTRSGYRWKKLLEDGNGEVIGHSTASVRDAKTGRLFLSGAMTPFITVCDLK